MNEVIAVELKLLKGEYDDIREHAVASMSKHRHRCLLCKKDACKVTGIEGPAGDQFRALLKCENCGAFGCVDHNGNNHA